MSHRLAQPQIAAAKFDAAVATRFGEANANRPANADLLAIQVPVAASGVHETETTNRRERR